MGVAQFSYQPWAARYPELAAYVKLDLATMYAAEATMYFDNTGRGPIKDPVKLGLLLNMITAHIAALNAPVNDGEAQALVGRVTNASEGSVSVAVAYDAPATAAWFIQTKYGAAAYQLMAPARTFRYVTGRRR